MIAKPNSLPRKHAWRIYLSLAIICATLVLAFSALIAPQYIWQAEFRRTEDLLNELEHARPDDVSEEHWDALLTVLSAALGNGCFSPRHASASQLRQLRSDLEARLQKPITLETIRWIWDRIGETSPSSKSYTKQWSFWFEEEMSRAKEETGEETKSQMRSDKTIGLHTG